MGFAKERSLGSTMAGNFGEEVALIKPACSLQIIYDHGNQSKGTASEFSSILW